MCVWLGILLLYFFFIRFILTFGILSDFKITASQASGGSKQWHRQPTTMDIQSGKICLAMRVHYSESKRKENDGQQR